MKLSICMMVKNEEKFLDKCLTHLKGFMKNIDSELIIVDTGSEDRTLDIAKKYTDRVYFHKWNNNFSEMRNITISYATGEWIFIIDADEMLIEYDDIIKFLYNKYAEKYNTVFINIKNLTDSNDNTSYSILSSPRIFRNNGEFKYEGAVHNIPKLKKPCAYLNGAIEHYGYIFEDVNFTENKFKRTSAILKNELEKNPDNIYYLYQLSVSYSMHEDKQEALNSILKAFQFVEKKIAKNDLKEYLYVYTQLALCYLKLDDLRKVEYVCAKAIEAQIYHIDIYYLLGKSRLILGKSKEAIEAYEQYLVILNNYENKDNISNQAYYHGKRDYVFFDLFVLYCKIEKFDKALECYSKIENIFILTSEESVEENINLYMNKNDYDGLKSFYENIVMKYEIRGTFILYLEKYENSNEINISKIKGILEEEDLYTDLLNFRLAIKNDSKSIYEDIEIIKHIEEADFNELYYFYGDILYYYMCYSFETFINCIKHVKENKIIEFFKYLDEKYYDFNELLLNILYFALEEDLNVINIKRVIAKYLVAVTEPEDRKYKEIFNIYIKYGISYIEIIYKVELLENEKIYFLKDEELTFFAYMRKANLIKTSDEEQYLKYLKKALNIYPYMHSGIKALLEELKQDGVNNEMEAYKKQVIETIKILVLENKLDQAKGIINEYEQIIPGDREIENIKKSMFT
ncbi:MULTISPECIES: glycosyltransferase family 2 protein [unclassified Clostridium]|uniref:glycosyltransferase family 2 protein n=1 Tax=unclassified Clostridium TaxID=2614128 RepID=UPI001EEA4190|nr:MULTISPECIES: glycosyltransferase family 2 protein [unclassified Clostridium]